MKRQENQQTHHLLLLAWAGACALWFASFGWRALITPDEGRYASSALGMLQSGDLPMFPALALIAARHLAVTKPEQLRRHLALPGMLWLAVLIGTPLAASTVAADVPPSIAGPLVLMTIVAAVIFLSCTALAWLVLGRGRALKSSKNLAPMMSDYLQPDMPVFAVRMYDQTLPFYPRRPVTLVEFRGEFAFGEDAEPQRWIPTVDAFATRWQALPRAVAMMPMQTYEELQTMQLPMQLPMQVVYQDSGRVVVLRPVKP